MGIPFYPMCDGHAPRAAHPGVLKLERDKGRSRGGPSSVAGDVQQDLYSDLTRKGKEPAKRRVDARLQAPQT